MIEKTKQLKEGDQRPTEMKINTSNLPLNLLVDDCNGLENDNKLDLIKNNNLLNKWNEKKTQIMVAKSHALNQSFNLPFDENGIVSEATMDPNINNLSKQCDNLTLSDINECSEKVNTWDFNKIYKEEDLKILYDLLNLLKKHKARLDSLDVEEEDTNEIVLRSRGHIKKNANKNRPTPFDKNKKDKSAFSERLQLATEPNLTLTTNAGNKAHVYVQNESYMQGAQEEDNLFPRFYHDQVILEALSDQQLIDQIIEDIESELNKTEVNECWGSPEAHPSSSHQSYHALNDSMSPQHSISGVFNPLFNNVTTQSCDQAYFNHSNPQACNSPSSFQFAINYGHNETQVSPTPQQSPYTPCQVETTDSSYETGSPSSSSAVTSPGSPCFRNSISSESDQELNAVETRFVKSVNIVKDQTTRFVQKTRPSVIKVEQVLKPLGKVIQCSAKSAEQTLDELSKSAPWKVHYIVQLVQVAISTKKNPNDCVEGFRESLMKTINTQMDKKLEKVWQLSIFVHLEFLKAPARVKEYKPALLRKHEKERSLVYIAAVERKCPLIARYISEIMYRVGYNPAEADGEGTSILHVLASLGDSHAEVLAELLAAVDGQNNKKIFNARIKNKEGKSLLHVAAASAQPQITTIVLLINYGADPLLQDKYGRTALQYHLMAMVGRMEGNRYQPIDMEMAKKLLPPSSIECRKALDRLSSELSTPSLLIPFIEDLKRERC